jgi:pterin-4a-carbinolamine dehydratase
VVINDYNKLAICSKNKKLQGWQKGEDNKRTKTLRYRQYCDTTAQLARCAEKSKSLNANIYLHNRHEENKLNNQHGVTI